MFKERWIWAATLLIMVAFGVGSWALSGKKGQRGRESEASYFMVERGPLTIHVRAPGTIRSQKAVVLKSKVEGRTTILWLIPEGSPVKKGDLLLELDSSDLEDKNLQQQIKVRKAEAAFVRARENLAVVQNQAESDIVDHANIFQGGRGYQTEDQGTEDEAGQHITGDSGDFYPMGQLAAEKSQKDDHADAE